MKRVIQIIHNVMLEFCIYTADKLWGGKQCEGTCCTNSKSPPWFSVRMGET